MSAGNDILVALKQSCATASSARWLGQSPAGDLVFVARASCVTDTDLTSMVRACTGVAGVECVRYEVDCGDRAVRLVVSVRTCARRQPWPPVATLVAELGAAAWSCRVLGVGSVLAQWLGLV